MKKMTLTQVIHALYDANFGDIEGMVPVRFGIDAGMNRMTLAMYLADEPRDPIFAIGFDEDDGPTSSSMERILEVIAHAASVSAKSTCLRRRPGCRIEATPRGVVEKSSGRGCSNARMKWPWRRGG